ncbi:MAG: hypothetical protein L6Q26_08200 [Anaerolineales bacterium]|nr:hypothetical protein [Anaerolineales bacterium]NUQ84243.1 hypothetical protein [Anaerolineales bacterium]
MTALIVFLVAALLLLFFTFMRRRSPGVFRRIEAYERLNRAIGLAVEGGTRLHISIGRGNLFTARGGSALAGLAMLRRLTERTSLSDKPPVVTSGDASLAILSQDTLQSGYRAAGAEDQYRFTTGRLTGLTPFAFAAGTTFVARDEDVSANVVIGDLGAEAALLADASESANADLIAGSDNLSAQSVFYAASQDPLIGEEVFAAGAYLGAGASHEASLQTQDVLRWLIILAIFGGIVLKFLGIGF